MADTSSLARPSASSTAPQAVPHSDRPDQPTAAKFSQPWRVAVHMKPYCMLSGLIRLYALSTCCIQWLPEIHAPLRETGLAHEAVGLRS
jgi:hypothetical protein